MSGRAKKKPAAAPKKKANGYKMPAPIATGEVIHDTLMKKKWRIGPSIGVGGFGEIYSACQHENSPKKGSDYPFVIKIEPHENGPLFVEKHFYVRNANKDDITKFMKSKKLTTFGMPTYAGNGSHDYKGEKYRYLVLERYGKDLWALFKENGRSFPPATVFQIGVQMLEVLEYIHSRGYVHADIKGANILLGLKKGTEHQAYLVDFGLATRVTDKEFKPEPKCAHNGTIEYTSRDAHLGVPTMRGDLEILAYNMLQWLAGSLPWEDRLGEPKAVQAAKEAFMKNVKAEVAKLGDVPEELIKFFTYINTLKPRDVPDYTKCVQILEGYLKKHGKTRNSKLEFTPTKKTVAKGRAKKLPESEEEDVEETVSKRKPKENGVKTSPRKKAKTKEPDSKEEDDTESKAKTKENGTEKPRRGRTPKILVQDTDSETENCENETPNGSAQTKAKVVRKKKSAKRKSSEPALLVNVKKTKLTPRATPPVRKGLVNTATQTSGSRTRKSPRQVSFDSPICAIIGEGKASKLSKDSEVNSSGDIFDDSFEIQEKKVKPRRKLLSDEEVTVKRVVKKKVTTLKPKAKSWRDTPAVLNGRSPPTS
ncbi:nucleosomal histone kinase 1 isoform X1 [Plutella xylostella]|uniref:nucleosomal histone kinase 1 isoform X1 n=1 Tax=Plutella xylostella TaxID=51655 RepID=UPI002032A0D9|nr:nucleosomal histone kinase 1 isoform X1 [Plutella xylostella]